VDLLLALWPACLQQLEVAVLELMSHVQGACYWHLLAAQ
jgi:hypothetical protein